MATAYLACANAANKAQDALAKKYPGSYRINTLRIIAAKYAAVEGTFIKCIRAVAWNGAPLTADIHTLLVRAAAVQITELAQSKAKSVYEFESYNKTVNTQELASSSAANVVRGDLGLPPPPV